MRTNSLFAAVLVVAFSSCQAVIPSGRVSTSTREVPPFRKVEVHSGLHLTATTGARSVTLRADDNLLPLLETTVINDVLVLGLANGVWAAPPRTLEATVSNDLFEGVQASGGSHVSVPATPTTGFPITASGGSIVEVSGLSSTEFSIDASGGSEVTLGGAATSGVAAASGGSHLRLAEVPLERLRVDASGGSVIDARASERITGHASGGSLITLQGTPSSDVELSGGSRLQTAAP